MGSRKSALREERGVTLVLMALMLFLALGMSALAIDYGMIKSAKAEGQRAMDAAALAGASAFLVTDPAADLSAIAQERAREYAAKHTVHRIPIDPATVNVDVDLPNYKVTASFSSPGIQLWFAQMFGSSTMGIFASATAHAEDAGISTCLMPIAIRDKWHNATPDPSEDLNGDGIMDYNDLNHNGNWDYAKKNGEPWEQWIFDPSEGDYYSPPNSYAPTGYSSADYGRQLVMMQFDPNATPISSNYLAWGKDGNAASDSALRARILDPSCDETSLGQSYTVSAGNGAKTNLGLAWDERIARAPSADWTWNNVTNEVSCPGGCPTEWEETSPRVVTIGLYDPAIVTQPQDNTITFLNFAKVFLDKRPCTGPPGGCKAEVTARFLGFAQGVGGPGNAVGPLNKRIVLIK
jgi:hypothetical protein